MSSAECRLLGILSALPSHVTSSGCRSDLQTGNHTGEYIRGGVGIPTELIIMK